MTRLCCLRPSVHFRHPSPSCIRHPGASTITQEWARLARLTSGPLSNLTGSSGVRSHIDKKEDMFWIRNRFQILVQKSAPDLGSEYGNQPYRSFREQSLPPSCPRNRAQHQHVCQHARQDATQRLIYSGTDCTVLLLRGRPRRRVVSLCTVQDASQRLIYSGTDCTILLLRGRPRRRVVSLCSRTNRRSNRSSLMPVGCLSNRRGGQ
jgi:hypothetical protein